MKNLRHTSLATTIKKDKALLEKTQLPIITVSSSYLEDLKGFYKLPEIDTTADVVFSRAHYSMALAVAVEAWGNKIDPAKAWVVDPTNYVHTKDWSGVVLTETIGKLLARAPMLKKLKDLVDKFGRNKLPILESITPPLLQLTKDIKKPILSMHIASGNILATQGKQVYQMITDPHVRADYLNEAQRDNIKFLVFDETTKADFFKKAKQLEKKVNPNQVIVTGPPIDPRIIKAGQTKKVWTNGPLKLVLTTGGLGTNKNELKQILQQLLPEMKKGSARIQVLVYAGTHQDIAHMIKKLALEENIAVNEVSETDPANFYAKGNLTQLKNSTSIKEKLNQAQLSLIYHPQIIDANELLTQFAFPWADGFISKPSGDMAYDAVASGSFLLTLQEWGEWELNIRKIFTKLGVAQKAQVADILTQLDHITTAHNKTKPWVTQAMQATHKIDQPFGCGVRNIVKTVQKNKN